MGVRKKKQEDVERKKLGHDKSKVFSSIFSFQAALDLYAKQEKQNKKLRIKNFNKFLKSTPPSPPTPKSADQTVWKIDSRTRKSFTPAADRNWNGVGGVVGGDAGGQEVVKWWLQKAQAINNTAPRLVVLTPQTAPSGGRRHIPARNKAIIARAAGPAKKNLQGSQGRTNRSLTRS